MTYYLDHGKQKAPAVGHRPFEAAVDAGVRALLADPARWKELTTLWERDQKSKTLPEMKTGLPSARPTFAVLTFHPDKDDPIVLLRSPEMGLQPDLTLWYLKQFLQVISKADVAARAKSGPGELRVSFFGTSGGAAAGIQPGMVGDIVAALYVGGKRSGGGFAADISFHDGTRATTLFNQPGFPSLKKATEKAQEQFLLPGLDKLAEKKLGKPLRKLLAEPRYKGKVGFTGSFFIGQSYKAKAADLGMRTVNMEDFWVLRAVSEDPVKALVKIASIERMDCDPPTIPEATIQAVTRWGKDPRSSYSVKQYVEAIAWGSSGSLFDPMPPPDWPGWWTITGLSPAIAYHVPPHGKVLDPYFSEIASDFLAEMRAGTVLRSGKDASGKPQYDGIVSFKVLEHLDEVAKATLFTLLHHLELDIQAKAAVVAAQAGGASGKAELTKLVHLTRALRLAPHVAAKDGKGQIVAAAVDEGKVAALVTALKGKLEGDKKTLLGQGLLRLLGAGTEHYGDQSPLAAMEVWTRANKWVYGNQSRTFDHLPVTEAAVMELRLDKDYQTTLAKDLVEVAIDRALFKSGLVPGPQVHAAPRVASELKKLAAIGGGKASTGTAPSKAPRKPAAKKPAAAAAGAP